MLNWGKVTSLDETSWVEKNSGDRIIIIIDASGSMGVVREDVISGFNKFLSEQKETSPDAYVTIATFDSSRGRKYVARSARISSVKQISHSDYVPQGGTPLWDAVGGVLNEAKDVFYDRNVVLIITDGQENSSVFWTPDKVRSMVEDLTSKGWKFAFLGANIDSFAVGSMISLTAHQTKDWNYHTFATTMGGLSGSVMSYLTNQTDELIVN